jgi:hypothetical protein
MSSQPSLLYTWNPNLKNLAEGAGLSGLRLVFFPQEKLISIWAVERSTIPDSSLREAAIMQPLYVGSCQSNNIFDILQGHGFRLWNIEPGFRGLDDELLQADALFLHS